MGVEPAEQPSYRTIPDRIGRFVVERQLGSGGMASVYLALEQGAGGFTRHVALKFLHPHLASEPSVVAQFVREAKIAARIRHPNVVSVLEVAQEGALVFLVMDFVDGESLASLTKKLGRSAIPPRVGLRILCDALAGLEAAHELKGDDGRPLEIVHRDFSPHNLLIGKDGVTRLSDFGVAKIAAGTQHTQAGVVKGKVGYMAPEQARGRSVDRRTDVWAAGVIAWELVAGRRLYPGADDLARLFDVATRTPPRLSSLVSGVAPALDEAVALALTRKPERRCASASELRARLEAAQGGGLAAPYEVAELVHAAQAANASGTELDPDELPNGSLSASITATTTSESFPAPAPAKRRWPVVLAGLAGAAVAAAAALVLTSASPTRAFERSTLGLGPPRTLALAAAPDTPAPKKSAPLPQRSGKQAPRSKSAKPPRSSSVPDAPLADYPKR